MKIDLLTHGSVNKFQTKDAARSGGAVGFAYHLFYGLREIGHDVNVIIGGEDLSKEQDVCFLCSFGVDKERSDKGKHVADKKYNQLKNKLVVPLIHSSYEFRFYKYSLPKLQKLNPPVVLVTTKSSVTYRAVKDMFPRSKIELLRLPFIFNEEQLKDKSQFTKTIACPTRIAGIKGTRKVLDIAENIPEKYFVMAGERKGIDWFRNISRHPHVAGANVFWTGPLAPMEVLDQAAFAIDLTTLWYKGELEGQRPQYTTLEAINCGCIPIMFENWQSDWDGIFLPQPTKIGTKHEWSRDVCVDIIKSEEYDFKLAIENFHSMRKLHNHKTVAKELENVLSSLS